MTSPRYDEPTRFDHFAGRLFIVCMGMIAGGIVGIALTGLATGDATAEGGVWWILRVGLALLGGLAAAVLSAGKTPKWVHSL